MQLVQDRKGAALRRGFTLVELVIVVLVLGILAAVAAPKMMGTAGSAKSNGTRQSLAVLRSAIEVYKAENGSYPALADLTTTFATARLNGPFPIAQVGSFTGTATVKDGSSAGSAAIAGPPTGTDSWIYNVNTGELRVNSTQDSAFTW